MTVVVFCWFDGLSNDSSCSPCRGDGNVLSYEKEISHGVASTFDLTSLMKVRVLQTNPVTTLITSSLMIGLRSEDSPPLAARSASLNQEVAFRAGDGMA